MSNYCLFCNSKKTTFIYNMNDYMIFQCKNCKTSFTYPMPTQDFLTTYYSGFSFQANIHNLPYFQDIKFNKWLFGLGIKKNSKMLDVGGGGGFFSYVFEYFGYGKATYIDLDDKACEFAQKQIGIQDVIHGDAMQLCSHSNQKYHFIYARHLIEHLINPLPFIDSLLTLLEDDGVLLLHFPNGNSLEYLAYPQMLEQRKQCVLSSNVNLNAKDLWYKIFKQQISHGMFPPRHLWAITEKGIKAYFEAKGLLIDTFFATMDDPIYSPYFKVDSFTKKIKTLTLGKFFASIHGASHLVVKITKVKV